jgi:predicted TIM-barrel fold metal-dependent hydrolase
VIDKSPPSDLPLIIDAHAHLGYFRNFHIPNPDIDSMIAVMNRCGIDVTVLSAHAAISSDFNRGNDESIQAAERHPDRVLVYCVINPNYPDDAESELKRCFAHPATRGIKLHPELHGDYPLDGPGYRPAWEYADEHHLPVLSHTYFAGDSLDTFARLAEQYPGATVIVGHGGVDHGIEHVVALASRYPNIMLDLCGVLTHRGVVEVLAHRVGADRLLLGTDMPFVNGAAQLGTLLYADLSRDSIQRIAAANAERLFGLPAAPR